MKYAVDRIEDNIAILQSLDTKKVIDVDLSYVDCPMKEGDIVTLKDNHFYLDTITKEEITNRIQDKLNKAKQN